MFTMTQGLLQPMATHHMSQLAVLLCRQAPYQQEPQGFPLPPPSVGDHYANIKVLSGIDEVLNSHTWNRLLV